MDISIGQTVSYAVSKVKIRNISLTKDATGSLVIMVPYQWLDADNKVIRSGNNRYTEDQLASIGTDAIAVLKSLVPSGTSGNCNVMLKDDGSVVATKGYSDIVDGSPKWIGTNLDADQFIAAIAPLTADQLKTMVTSFTAAVFA